MRTTWSQWWIHARKCRMLLKLVNVRFLLNWLPYKSSITEKFRGSNKKSDYSLTRVIWRNLAIRSPKGSTTSPHLTLWFWLEERRSSLTRLLCQLSHLLPCQFLIFKGILRLRCPRFNIILYNWSDHEDGQVYFKKNCELFFQYQDWWLHLHGSI